jgi:hypothetical protein
MADKKMSQKELKEGWQRYAQWKAKLRIAWEKPQKQQKERKDK